MISYYVNALDRRRFGRWSLFIGGLTVVGLIGYVVGSDKTDEATIPTGTIEGRVIYKSDPQRPWRFGRYYIKYASRGHLSEAVVALKSSSLSKRRSPMERAEESKTLVMDQKDFRFVPESLAIRVGDRVKFTNSDIQVHNVKSYAGAQPFNVNTPTGGEYLHTFAANTGSQRPIRIGCSFHSQMQAWIYVFPHPHFQVTGEDGRFKLTDVPPGDYDLEMAHAAGELQKTEKVTVRAGEVTTIDILVSPDEQVESKP